MLNIKVPQTLMKATSTWHLINHKIFFKEIKYHLSYSLHLMLISIIFYRIYENVLTGCNP